MYLGPEAANIRKVKKPRNVKAAKSPILLDWNKILPSRYIETTVRQLMIKNMKRTVYTSSLLKYLEIITPRPATIEVKGLLLSNMLTSGGTPSAILCPLYKGVAQSLASLS